MSAKDHQLHIFFFPFLAHGHLLPTVDMAKLFASRGVVTTIVTTPVNASHYLKRIQGTKNMGFAINIESIKFPALDVGLPEGFENVDSIKDEDMSEEIRNKFFKATTMLQKPLEQLLQDFCPTCLVADIFFPWATDVAAKFGIPRLVFHGSSFFSLSTSVCLGMHRPHEKVSSDTEPFLVPNLPGDIKFIKSQLPEHIIQDGDPVLIKFLEQANESELKSYGAIFNSFYELEPAYSDFYKKVLGRRSWNIGPVSLCNRTIEDKAQRGLEASIDESECLKWLDSKKPDSVVYICFGSATYFTVSQLNEIAMGLEASGQKFIWVVRKEKRTTEEKEEWLPEGFEKRMEGKGLIIRGWAPQLLILDHEAIGGFVTHCGWNSVIEGVTAGKPMVTWPVFVEQFYNEKLVTQVLRIGIGVGAQTWTWLHGDDSIKSEAIEKAVTRVMVGEEAEEMRNRVKAFGDMARRAVEEGGSSFSELNVLIEELRIETMK